MSPVHTAVLVEGESDRQAVLAAASAEGRDLADEGILVVAMGGATNVPSAPTAPPDVTLILSGYVTNQNDTSLSVTSIPTTSSYAAATSKMNSFERWVWMRWWLSSKIRAS